MDKVDFDKLIREDPLAYLKMASAPDFKDKYPEQHQKDLEAIRHLGELPHLVIDQDSDPEQVQQEMKMFGHE